MMLAELVCWCIGGRVTARRLLVVRLWLMLVAVISLGIGMTIRDQGWVDTNSADGDVGVYVSGMGIGWTSDRPTRISIWVCDGAGRWSWRCPA